MICIASNQLQLVWNDTILPPSLTQAHKCMMSLFNTIVLNRITQEISVGWLSHKYQYHWTGRAEYNNSAKSLLKCSKSCPQTSTEKFWSTFFLHYWQPGLNPAITCINNNIRLCIHPCCHSPGVNEWSLHPYKWYLEVCRPDWCELYTDFIHGATVNYNMPNDQWPKGINNILYY